MASVGYTIVVFAITSLHLQATCGAIRMEESSNIITLEEGKETAIHCYAKIPLDRACNRRIFSWVFVNATGKESYFANATSLQSRQYIGRYSVSYYERGIFGSNLKECLFTLELHNANSALTGTYSCRWNNQMSSEVTINVLPSQESVQPHCSIHITDLNQTKQEVELVCFASPINPFVKLLWFQEGEQMDILTREAQPGSLTSKALLLPRNDSQTDITYVCQAFNKTDHELPRRCSITCHVDISISETKEEDSSQPQGTFKCPFNMSLNGIRYQREWLLDGQPINQHDQTDRFIIEGHTGLLHMTKILPEDKGRLLGCTVKTMFGSYSAEMLIAQDVGQLPKEPQAGPQRQSYSLLLLLLFLSIILIVTINVFVCYTVMKRRGRNHQVVDPNTTHLMYQQQEALYASGIVVTGTNGVAVNDGYTPMTDVCPGHHHPEEPYEAMSSGDGKRDSEYQVPQVDADGAPVKRQQSAKYMNTLGGGGGGKNKGFNIFRFSKRKEQRYAKTGNLDYCTGGDEGPSVVPISPNCYDAPQYPTGSTLSAPSNITKDNDYDEFNLKVEP